MSFTIRGLNHLGIVVDDIRKAKNFFVDILGMKLVQDRGELIFLEAGKDILAIKTPAMAVNKPEHGGEPKEFTTKSGWQALDLSPGAAR